MNAVVVAMRAGVGRGWIEFRQTVTSVGDLIGWLSPLFLPMIVLFALRGDTVPGTSFSVGTQAVPGVLGMMVLFVGMLGIAMALMMDRLDGTLLRVRAVPGGVLGYLTGKVVGQAAMTTAVVVIVLVPCGFLFDGIEVDVVALVGVLALGIVATSPLGGVIGALFTGPQRMSLLALLVTGLTAISGVFYPITALPEWLQWVGQVFPVYWLGLGMRSALLPDALAAAELGGSWRHLETLGALGAWLVLGLVLAPIIVRRTGKR